MIRTFRMEVLLWAEVGTFIVYQVTNSLVFLWRDVWDWGEWRWIWRDKYVVIKDSLLHYSKGYFWNPNPSLKIRNAREKNTMNIGLWGHWSQNSKCPCASKSFRHPCAFASLLKGILDSSAYKSTSLQISKMIHIFSNSPSFQIYCWCSYHSHWLQISLDWKANGACSKGNLK